MKIVYRVQSFVPNYSPRLTKYEVLILGPKSVALIRLC